MPKVKMLSTQRGSEDGIHLVTHVKGESYELGEWLAGVYVREGWAVDADAPAPVPVVDPPAPVAAQAPVVKPKRNAAQKTPQRRKGSK